MPPRSVMTDQRSDLHRAKVGVAVLATCIIEAVNESDPSFKERVLKKIQQAYYKLRDDTEGDQTEQLELLQWTQEFLTGFDLIRGQGEPFFDS